MRGQSAHLNSNQQNDDICCYQKLTEGEPVNGCETVERITHNLSELFHMNNDYLHISRVIHYFECVIEPTNNFDALNGNVHRFICLTDI